MKITVKEFLALISRKEVGYTDLLVNDTSYWYVRKKALVVGDNGESTTLPIEAVITVSGKLMAEVDISLWAKLLKKDGGESGGDKV